VPRRNRCLATPFGLKKAGQELQLFGKTLAAGWFCRRAAGDCGQSTMTVGMAGFKKTKGGFHVAAPTDTCTQLIQRLRMSMSKIRDQGIPFNGELHFRIMF